MKYALPYKGASEEDEYKSNTSDEIRLEMIMEGRIRTSHYLINSDGIYNVVAIFTPLDLMRREALHIGSKKITVIKGDYIKFLGAKVKEIGG